MAVCLKAHCLYPSDSHQQSSCGNRVKTAVDPKRGKGKRGGLDRLLRYDQGISIIQHCPRGGLVLSESVRQLAGVRCVLFCFRDTRCTDSGLHHAAACVLTPYATLFRYVDCSLKRGADDRICCLSALFHGVCAEKTHSLMNVC